MERGRRPPEPFQDQYMGGRGQSYRPESGRDRSPPRNEAYRPRSPTRRFEHDTYRGGRERSRSPGGRRDDFRRRSRTPPDYRDANSSFRGIGDSYRARPRSPPLRRENLAREDLFRREPPRDFRADNRPRDDRAFRDERGFDGRSPVPRYRDRSPGPLKRTREPSPVSSRGRRSPPLAKRERLASPPRARYDNYSNSRGASPTRRPFSPDSRSGRPSPPRGAPNEYTNRPRSPAHRTDPHGGENWRRSSPRHTREDFAADDVGRDSRNSHPSSRRSSPPPGGVRHPRVDAIDERSARQSPVSRDTYDSRESYKAASPASRRQSPSSRDREYHDDRGYSGGDGRAPPVEPVRHESSNNRAPPTGPAGFRAPGSAMAPPAGPSAISTSAPVRAAVVPPSGPRAQTQAVPSSASRGRGGFSADFSSRGGRGSSFPTSFRGGRGGVVPGYGRGEPNQAEYQQGPPTGPRATVPAGPRGSFSNEASPTAYQRSQRFAPNGQPISDGPSAPPTGPRAQRRPTEPSLDYRSGPHPAIADLPKILPGGLKPEPLVDRTRLNKLEDEAERLRRSIEEREIKKKKNLHEWDRLTRETEVASLRSELAEQSMRLLNGEAESQAAF